MLSIGDTVEEVTDSGFLGTTPTLCCSSLGDDALVQVGSDCSAIINCSDVKSLYGSRWIYKPVRLRVPGFTNTAQYLESIQVVDTIYIYIELRLFFPNRGATHDRTRFLVEFFNNKYLELAYYYNTINKFDCLNFITLRQLRGLSRFNGYMHMGISRKCPEK